MDTFHTMTDEELVVMYVNGNNEAFDELLTRHQHSLYSYISTRSAIMASRRIFSDTFMKAIITIQQGKYTESGKFKADRPSRGTDIDHFRQKRVRTLFPTTLTR